LRKGIKKMATRNILNQQGQIIGQLELPDGTSEEEWTRQLAKYTQSQATPVRDVTPRQIRQAWILSGKQLSEIDDAIAALPEPHRSLAQIEWEYSTIVMRNNPLVAMLGQAQGYTSQQLDDLWILAASL
jgi:hypothetical protein